ncbi:MAG: hypothetical protein E6J90_25765 [Deltaproteobacteria bacterium]|nr:MAG: hypothetical protein E6J91_39420 [Deltaproteobacteria bacterium]TMQ15231.1 MAG: hypothetical protein E6J90_25765 [Deltaproteobacteria bacterium]
MAAAKSRFWPVEDEPSVAIMTDLYRRLTAEPVATALASVQEEHHRAGHPASTWVGLVFYDND